MAIMRKKNTYIDTVGVGVILYNARIKMGISADALASWLGIDRRTIYKREAGHLPNLEKLAEHAHIFDMRIEDILVYNDLILLPFHPIGGDSDIFPVNQR